VSSRSLKTKARFSCLLRNPTWKWRGPILVLALHKFVTYFLRHLPTYLQPRTHTGPNGQIQLSEVRQLCALMWHDNNFRINWTLTCNACREKMPLQITKRMIMQFITRWLYCVECPQYSTRLEAPGYLYTCHLTQCRLRWGLTPYQVASWSIQPNGHNRHGPRLIDWVGFNVPLNTLLVISGTGFYGSNDPTNSVKIGGCVSLMGAELGSHVTQCAWAEAYLHTKWHIDPSSRFAT